jgi:hypothetical protein
VLDPPVLDVAPEAPPPCDKSRFGGAEILFSGMESSTHDVEPVEPFLGKTRDLGLFAAVAHVGYLYHYPTGRHAAEVTVPLEQDGPGARPGRRYSRRMSPWTPTHNDYVCFIADIDLLSGFKNGFE